MSSLWIGLATIAISAGGTVYGAQQQKKAVAAANQTNADLTDKQNNSAWASYLLSRGVNPEGSAAGTFPANPQPVNVKLPIWASVNRPGTAAPGFRIGPQGGPSLAITKGLNTGAPAVDPSAAGGAGGTPSSSGTSTVNKIASNIVDPLGLFPNAKKNPFDPFGIF